MREDVLDLIGNTPMVKLEGVYIKLEHLNPSGSTKDRIAKYILEQAEKKGLLKEGFKVVEATSGNSGIAFSMVCAVKGYQMVVIMPKGMTEERKEIMEAYGAKIVMTSQKESVGGAMEKELSLEGHKGYYLVKQFENPWNVKAHRMTLGKEILKEVKRVDAFVAGVGTGGTLIGVGQALRGKNKKVKLFAVEPKESAVLSGGKPGHHKIDGIGDGFIPKIYEEHADFVNGVITVSSSEAIAETRRIAKEYGLLVGISSGANFLAAKKLRKRFKNVVTVFPDSGDRYLSEHYF
ncbi:cysteine synthase family protein [Candidatus Woesearchaeota archaeon]|nr:cysteine synthase family protein [Candidatus Woesearchaeota archaeon]